MSVDTFYQARAPGLVPPALLRSALHFASSRRPSGAPLRFDPDEDTDGNLGAYGASVTVLLDDFDEPDLYLTMHQPEDDADYFTLALSHKTSIESSTLDSLADILDDLATKLRLVTGDSDAFDDVEDRVARHVKKETSVDVVAVRVAIDVRQKGTPIPTEVIALEGSPLASVGEDQLEALRQMLERSVAWSLDLSPRGAGAVALDTLRTWIGDSYEVEREGDYLRVRDAGDDGSPLATLEVEGDWVTFRAWPAIEADHEIALEMNASSFEYASLGLDHEGDWWLGARLASVGLGAKAFSTALDAYYADLRLAVEELGIEDE